MFLSTPAPHTNIPPCSLLTWQNYLKISLAFYTQHDVDNVVIDNDWRELGNLHVLHVHSLI
jgi:hypothetical protein